MSTRVREAEPRQPCPVAPHHPHHHSRSGMSVVTSNGTAILVQQVISRARGVQTEGTSQGSSIVSRDAEVLQQGEEGAWHRSEGAQE